MFAYALSIELENPKCSFPRLDHPFFRLLDQHLYPTIPEKYNQLFPLARQEREPSKLNVLGVVLHV